LKDDSRTEWECSAKYYSGPYERFRAGRYLQSACYSTTINNCCTRNEADLVLSTGGTQPMPENHIDVLPLSAELNLQNRLHFTCGDIRVVYPNDGFTFSKLKIYSFPLLNNLI
jgi:hypothetical protein